MGIVTKRFPMSPKLYLMKYQAEPDVTTFTVPEGVTDIGVNAFAGQTELTEVILPDSVERIGAVAFMGCTALTKITLPPYLRILEQGAFANTGITEITVPRSVKTLEAAFWDCKKLHTANLQCRLKSLPKGMFSGCTSLRSVTLPASLESIGYHAFTKCAFTQIALPDSLTKIGEEAFWRCNQLREVTLPESLRCIDRAAFRDCPITSVRIPESVETIGFYALPVRDVIFETEIAGETLRFRGASFDGWGPHETELFTLLRHHASPDAPFMFHGLKLVEYRIASAVCLARLHPEEEIYRQFIRKHGDMIAKYNMDLADEHGFAALLEYKTLTEAQSLLLLKESIAQEMPAFTAALLHYRFEQFGTPEDTGILRL